MAEYDLDGWVATDLITPDDVNLFLKKNKKGQRGSQWASGGTSG
jgi:hypothetical protein